MTTYPNNFTTVYSLFSPLLDISTNTLPTSFYISFPNLLPSPTFPQINHLVIRASLISSSSQLNVLNLIISSDWFEFESIAHEETIMAEEQNWEEANNHTLCANNCGFFGSPTTLNLCSKCYKDHRLKEQQMSTAKIAVEKSLCQPQHLPETSSSYSATISTDSPVTDSVPEPEVVVKSQPRNRCGSCKRRVGLTGFTCRCGTTFCGTHRYPEQHACTFDFKTMGKEAIAKANPVVKASKLEKI